MSNNKVLCDRYVELNDLWGLWNSEVDTICKWVKPSDAILDIGCGTGRISIGLSKLGYLNITAIDINEHMIDKAKETTPSRYDIEYIIADIVELNIERTFDAIIFGYNGLMDIVGKKNRLRALNNISKHMKKDGIYIFTSHLGIDDKKSSFCKFWQKRKIDFLENNKDIESDDFYTIMVEDKGVEINQFFAKDKDIYDDLMRCGFKVIETFRRNERFVEKKEVADNTNDCRFWICKKIV